MTDFWKNAASTGSTLTAETFRKAMEEVMRFRPPHPCQLGQHVVHPRAKERGYGWCVNCGSPVGDWPVR